MSISTGTTSQTFTIPHTLLSPSIAFLAGPNKRFYYAVSTSTGIQIGCIRESTTIEWIFQDPSFVSKGVDTQPVIALGTNNDLYLAFVTDNAVPNRTNMVNSLSFCPAASKSPLDLVVVCIDIIEKPRVVWVLQDATINTDRDETTPQLLYDRVNGQLLVMYETTGSLYCQTPVGISNIVLTSIDPLTGRVQWNNQSSSLNATGVTNTAPTLVSRFYNSTGPYLFAREVGPNTSVSSLQINPSSVFIEWMFEIQGASRPQLFVDPNTTEVFTLSYILSGIFTIERRSCFTGDLLWTFTLPNVLNPRICMDAKGGLYATWISLNTSESIIARIHPDRGELQWTLSLGIIGTAPIFGAAFEHQLMTVQANSSNTGLVWNVLKQYIDYSGRKTAYEYCEFKHVDYVFQT